MSDGRIRRALALAILLVPVLVHAQASPEAEKLFRDGKQLMKDGKLAEACAAFEASEKSEHNLATVMSLADCREKNHQYASAWAGFLQAYSLTRNDPKQATFNATAKKRSSDLEPRLSYLTINVPDDSRIDGLVVTRDGLAIDAGGWNTAIPIDGGDHVIAGRAPGHEPWTTTITMGAENDKQAVEVPRFKELPKEINKPTVIVQQVHTTEPSWWNGKRKVMVASGGVGVLAIGAGVILGLQSKADENDALATCDPASCSTDGETAANLLHQTAKRRALEANIAFAVGGAAVITAGIVWYLDHRDHRHPVDETAIRIVPTTGEATGFAIVGGF
ncbi:MAG TPA: hypothetical protein VL463_15105 [Kofleriaceae bacterium]|jgi:hypothetical protein|nr:hypothetical protein [Kofleriaceae bacterium]